MNAPDPAAEPIEVVLDGIAGSRAPGPGSDADGSIEHTDLLDSRNRKRGSRKRPAAVLAVVALLALGVMAWRVFPGDDSAVDSAADSAVDASDETDESQLDPGDNPSDDPDGTVPGAEQDPEQDGEQVEANDNSIPDAGEASVVDVDSPEPGEFPLFDDDAELVVAVLVGDELRLVDAITGSVRTVALPAADSSGFDGDIFDQRQIEEFGGRIVVGRQGRAIGVPKDAGASIDFGPASAFFVDGIGDDQRLVVVRQIGDPDGSNPGQSAPEFESQLFGFEGEAIGEVQKLPEYPSLFSFVSVMSGLVGTYQLGDDGFERLSTGYVVAAGDNHALVNECDDVLVCERVLIDLNTGELSDTADLPGGLPFDGFGGSLISPDGRWLVTEGGFGRLVDLGTGETLNLGPEVRLAQPLAFTPDGRYAVAIRLRNLLVVDLETGAARSVIAEDLGTVNERSVAVIFDQAE